MSSVDPDKEAVTPATVKRLFILSAVPFAGFALIAVGGILWFNAASSNNSLNCSSFGNSFGVPPACTHHSYVASIVLVVLGVLIMFGGGLYANYYAARRVGLPLLGAFLNRGRAQQMQPPFTPPEPPFTPPPGG